MYQFIEHTADVAFHVCADSFPALLSDAGKALTACLVANPDAIGAAVAHRIEVSGDQQDYLLFDWLSALLCAFETEQLVFSEFIATERDPGILATARGEPFDLERHGRGNEVKAITYHGLRVEQCGKQWHADVVIDI